MFVRYYAMVDRPIEECRHVLLDELEGWLPKIATAAEEPARQILAKVGFSVVALSIRKQVVVSVGQPVGVKDWLHIPVSWHASPAEALFATFDGEIQMVPIDPRVTKVAVSGTCEPPLDAVGHTIDSLLLHTAAEATVKDLVDRIARRLGPIHADGREPI